MVIGFGYWAMCVYLSSASAPVPAKAYQRLLIGRISYVLCHAIRVIVIVWHQMHQHAAIYNAGRSSRKKTVLL